MNFALYLDDIDRLLAMLPETDPLVPALRDYRALENEASELYRRIDRARTRAERAQLAVDIRAFCDKLSAYPALQHEGVRLSAFAQFEDIPV